MRISRVPEDKPLYDILNEFQKGHSHMAVVVKKSHSQRTSDDGGKNMRSRKLYLWSLNWRTCPPKTDVKLDIDGRRASDVVKGYRALTRWKSLPVNAQSSSQRGSTRSRSFRSRDTLSDILKINETPLPALPEEEAVGIITMEDVIEELLQVMISLHHNRSFSSRLRPKQTLDNFRKRFTTRQTNGTMLETRKTLKSPEKTLQQLNHMIDNNNNELRPRSFFISAYLAAGPQQRRRDLLLLPPSPLHLSFSLRSLTPLRLYILKVTFLSAAMTLTLSVISAAIWRL